MLLQGEHAKAMTNVEVKKKTGPGWTPPGTAGNLTTTMGCYLRVICSGWYLKNSKIVTMFKLNHMWSEHNTNTTDEVKMIWWYIFSFFCHISKYKLSCSLQAAPNTNFQTVCSTLMAHLCTRSHCNEVNWHKFAPGIVTGGKSAFTQVVDRDRKEARALEKSGKSYISWYSGGKKPIRRKIA